MDSPNTQATMPSIRFLHDEAATEDAFGPHGRIAGLIADAICGDPDVRIVGLLGPWGSGKSTVVGFVEAALTARTDVDYEVFTFDAWLNQGDAPRRAFLEALVRFVGDNGLTPGTDWTEQLHRITGRLEVTRAVETSLDTRLSKTMRLAVPVTALGVGMLARANDVALLGTGSVSAATLTGALFSLALPLAALAYYSASRPTWKFWTGPFFTWDNWRTRAEPYSDESLTAMLLFKAGTRRQSRIYRDPTPSSIEFQDIVHDVLVCLAENKKRLLVVVDNLDRLPEDEALGLWAVIRTFFLGDRRPSAPGASDSDAHATILLPIDEKAVELLYARNAKADGDARARAEAFMDKTFDLTLRLPRPAFLDWQSYVADQLCIMFDTPPHADAAHIVTRLLDAHFLKDNDDAPITPRRIKSILNRIGLTWLQWRNADLAFASVAWYAIDQANIDAGIMAAVASRAPVAVFDLHWQRTLAALHFGVSSDKALSLLIDGPLHRAINENNISAFRHARELPGFDVVLSRLFERMVQQQNAPQRPVVHATMLVAECIDDDGPVSRHLWNQLSKAAVEAVEWSTLSEDDAEALAGICYRVEPGGRRVWLQALMASFTPLLTRTGAMTLAPEVALVLNSLSGPDEPHSLASRPFHVPGNADFFVALLAEFVDHPCLPDLRTTATAAELGSTLTADFANLSFAGDAADRRIRALARWDRGVGWTSALAQAENILFRGPAMKAGNALLLTGLLQAKNEQAHDILKRVAEQNGLAGRISEAYHQQDLPGLARSLALSILGAPAFVPGFLTREVIDTAWPELPGELQQTLDEFGISSQLTTAALTRIAVEHPSLNALLQPVVERRIANWRVLSEPLDELLRVANDLANLIGGPLFSALTNRLASGGDFWTVLPGIPLDEDAAVLFETLLQDAVPRERVRDELKARIANFGSDQWETVLLRGERLAPLLAVADVISHTDDTLPLALINVLTRSHLTTGQGAVDRWLILAACLSPTEAHAAHISLRNLLLERAPSVPLNAFLLAPGKSVLLQPAFLDRPDLVLPFLTDELVLRVDNEAVLRHVIADIAILLRHADAATRDNVSRAVTSLDASVDPARHALGAELRAAWGLERTAEAEGDRPAQ